MTTQVTELFTRGLRAQRRSTIVWTAALVLLAISVVSVWPSMEDSGSLDSLTEGLSPELAAAFGLSDFASASGYLRGNLYAVLLPLLLGIMAITAATALTSGDEDSGRLELLLALPVRRQSVYLLRLTAVVAALAITSVVVAAVLAASAVGLDMDVMVSGVIAVSVAIWLLAVLHAGVAYTAAAAGLGRAATMGVAAAVLVVGYLLHAIAPLSSALEPLAVISPWEWALGNDPLSNGFDLVGLALLASASVVVVAVGTPLVDRRDVRTA